MPLTSPLAIDGAAPSTTTNMIAVSLSLKSTMAAGNHATDGIVCSPVIIEPTAARSTGIRETNAPTTLPITRAIAKPCTARPSVRRAAGKITSQLSNSARNVSIGDGKR
jgi:hypothetical protein